MGPTMKSIVLTILVLGLITFMTFRSLRTLKPEGPVAAQTETVPLNPMQQLPSVEMILAHIETIAQCERQQNCPFRGDDPNATQIAIGQSIKKDLQLLVLHASEQANPLLSRVARQYIQFDSDPVQVAALTLMATQVPTPSNVPAIIHGLRLSHDANLYRLALVEFQRYPDARSQAKIQRFLLHTLRGGKQMSKNQVARSLLPLLAANNIQQFRQVLSELPPQQASTRALQQSIEEFDRLQQGD